MVIRGLSGQRELCIEENNRKFENILLDFAVTKTYNTVKHKQGKAPRTKRPSTLRWQNYSDGHMINFREVKFIDKLFHLSLLAVLRMIRQSMLKCLFFPGSSEGSCVGGCLKLSLQSSTRDMPAVTLTPTPV